jgi:carbonic anhydrase
MSTPTTQPSAAPAIGIATARNRAFAEAGGHEGATPLATLRLFVVTCLDPRTDPAHLLGLQLSEAFVVRNVGGRVTDEVIANVAFVAQIAENVSPDGEEPFFEVAIIHHNQCGAIALADDGFRTTYAGRIGADENELRDHAVLDPRATVAIDVERLRQADAVPARVLVSGHVYDVTTGLLETTIPVARH